MLTLTGKATLVAFICTMGNSVRTSCESFGAEPEDPACTRQARCPVGSARLSSVAASPGPITNSVGMKLVPISPGEFVMGSRESADELSEVFGDTINVPPSDEFPLHRVRITKGFYLGAHHVTVAQFRQFVRSTGHRTEPEVGPPRGEIGASGSSWYCELPRARQPDGRRAYTWRNPGFRQADDHPVLQVSWDDAVAFCQWLSRKEGKTYRLPTEAEWEYACRAGTATRYHNGDDPEKLAEVANIADGTARQIRLEANRRFEDTYGMRSWDTLPRYAIHAKDGYSYTSPVGKFKPNAWGVYDMHGNAKQWCADAYDSGYYRMSPLDDPQAPVKQEEDCSQVGRVLRGASWHCPAYEARSATRDSRPHFVAADFIGFRVVCELDSTKSSSE